MNLSPSAKKALDDILEKQNALRSMKEMLEAEFRVELERRLEPLIKDRNVAVKLADQLGAPRTKIGVALGTTNYKTVQDILETTKMPASDVSQTGSNWSVAQVSDGWKLSIVGLGEAGVTGSATVRLEEGDIVYVSGDGFVVPQVYRNGLAEEVKLVLR